MSVQATQDSGWWTKANDLELVVLHALQLAKELSPALGGSGLQLLYTVAERLERPRPDERRLAALRAMPYSDYLSSPEWRRTRELALERSGWRCELCGDEDGPFNVHHCTYSNRGHERPEDVVTLCRSCHSSHHGRGSS